MMAKVNKPVKEKEFPSQFGSHSSMVDGIACRELNDVSKVVCKDQFGYYTTETWRIDDGMTDPNRCAGSRVKIG